MAISESSYLKDLWERNTCPYCHTHIPADKRVGSGRISDGGFCNLGCFARYHELDLIKKARLFNRRIPER
jgi:hypothetical protein